MTWSSLARLALAFGIIMWSAQPVGCQQLRELEVGFRNHARDSADESHPSALALNVKSAGWAVYGSVVAGAMGLLVDGENCKKHHGGESSLLGPCALYASGGFAAGWFGGATVGAAAGAARVAQKRGCPRRAAIARAFLGAALGAAPGVSIAVSRPGNYLRSRSLVILSTPLLTGVGAAAAVMGCHGP